MTQPIVREFEADLTIVAASEVAADVLALTLAATRRLGPAAVDARRAHRPGAGRRPRPPVLAVRQPGRQHAVAGRGVARSRQPGRLQGGARRAPRGRHGTGPRSAQPLPDGQLAALPLRRGRHRDHADAADDRRRRGGRRRVAPGVRRPLPHLHGVPRRAGGIRRQGERAAPGRGGDAGPRRCCSAARSPTPSSTPADRPDSSTRSRRGAPLRGRPVPCTWSDSRPRLPTPAATPRSSWSCSAPA